jgi:hypothetical protein
MEFRPFLPVASLGLMTIVGFAAIGYPWFSAGPHPDNWTLHVVLTIFGLLVLGNVLHARTSRVVLRPDSVEKRSLIGRRSLRFADVRRIELDRIVFKQGSQEVIRLASGDTTLEIPELFGPFDRLRDSLLASCKQAVVQDLRA